MSLRTTPRFLAPIAFAAALALVALAPSAQAAPFLQLDIAGGVYDPATERIVTGDDRFTLYAYVNPNPSQAASALADTYYLAVAITPQTGPLDITLGSVVIDGTSYDATADFTYGVPPIERDGTAAHDGGDLARHGVYETFFLQVSFVVDPTLTSGEYDTAENAGLGPIAGNAMYYRGFDIDVSGLDPRAELHFDLFTVRAGNCPGGPRSGACNDLDVARFAPFSHSAGTVPAIPEPSAALIFAAGAFVTRFARRRG